MPTLSDSLKSLSHGLEFVHRARADVDAGGNQHGKGHLADLSEDGSNLLTQGVPLTPRDLPALLDAMRNMSSGELDDRKLLLEIMVKAMSRMHTLPDARAAAASLEHTFIDILYKDLPHPPSGYLSTPTITPKLNTADQANPRLKYARRSDDGSGYNPLFPAMGMAGEPYARSVPSLHPTPASSLPDAGLIFDTLLKRDKFVEHPGGISSLFFAFANLIIHTLFNTNYMDETINDNSSYLDLSPLYGGGPSHFVRPVDEMRVFDGTGKIWADTFADSRLLFMPPATAALLILFNRNHNFICDKILNINENKTYSNPPPNDDARKRQQDDEIFSRARLVNCGFFMQIILQDYVGSILGLESEGLTWRLNPLEYTRQASHDISPRGQGNVCSVEFNLLYRWHSTMSQHDENWMSKEFQALFPGKEYDQITPEDFKNTARTKLRPDRDAKKWTFGGLQRVDGTFKDDDLAKIIINATEEPAAAFNGRATPAWMRVIEVLGIEEARKWGTCTLNEFRKFIGLKPLKSFKEWNPDESIWKAAEALYSDVDNIELYVGMQAEAAKKPMPGAGLCPGYTISRAILGDAVALVRGDPYLTTEMTPYQFTSWGYQDCVPDADDGAFGGMMTRLLLRMLPQYYGSRSARALFPFQTPEYMKTALSKLASDESTKYRWDRLQEPISTLPITSYHTAEYILGNRQDFVPVSGGVTALLDNDRLHGSPLAISQALKNNLPKWKSGMERSLRELIGDKTIVHVGTASRKILDIVQVINLLPCYFISHELAGIQLKTRTNPNGVYKPLELQQMFADIANYSYLNLELTEEWSLRHRAAEAVKKISPGIKRHFAGIADGTISIANIVDQSLKLGTNLNDNSGAFFTEVHDHRGDASPADLAQGIIAEVVASAAIWSSAVAHIIEYFLDDEHLAERQALLQLNDQDMLPYLHEALRLNPPFSTVYREVRHDAELDGRDATVGSRVLVSLCDANSDVKMFGEHTGSFNPGSALPLFNICGHGLMLPEFFTTTVPGVVRNILSLSDVRKAPGLSGKIDRFHQTIHGVSQTIYVDNHGKLTPFPSSLLVQYAA